MKKAKFKLGDKVRILDGSKIDHYTGSWSGKMGRYVGDIVTIRSINTGWDDGRVSYHMKERDYCWDERGLELVKFTPIVHIWCEDNKVYAKDVLSSKTAFARCSPEDDFDFLTGAKLALERLEKLNQPLAVGDEVRVINTGEIYANNWRWVCEHIKDGGLKTRFAYGEDLGYPNVRRLDNKFIIRAIADNKAYIELVTPGFGACHVIGLAGLERW